MHRLFRWYNSNYFTDTMVKLTVPPGALYENTEFRYERENVSGDFYPYRHRIHTGEVPLHKYCTLSVKADGIPDRLLGKTGIVLLPPKGGPEWEGGEAKNGWISASIREFGVFTLAPDTVAPEITPLNIGMNRDMSGSNSLRFSISDKLSGISS